MSKKKVLVGCAPRTDSGVIAYNWCDDVQLMPKRK